MIDAVNRFFIALENYKTSENAFSFTEGVEVGLRPSRAGDSVYLLKIRSADRGKGKASDSLRTVCDFADEYNVEIFLEVEESDGLDSAQLADWYWRFGFRGDVREMIRIPVEPQEC